MSKAFRPGALLGLRLGISISESADLNSFGVREIHFRLALEEIMHTVLAAGGYLAYGGDLRANGYATFLAHELDRYGRTDRPMMLSLSWSEHRKLALSRLRAELSAINRCVKTVCLDAFGQPVDPAVGRGEEPPAPDDLPVRQRSLSVLRHAMVEQTGARILLGGRREGYEGELPGALEEATHSLRRGQPIYIVGGFGGVARDVAVMLGVGDVSPQTDTVVDERVSNGLARLSEIAKETQYRSLKNGLTQEENRRLATSQRASEIASLVSQGLRRRFATSLH